MVQLYKSWMRMSGFSTFYLPMLRLLLLWFVIALSCGLLCTGFFSFESVMLLSITLKFQQPTKEYSIIKLAKGLVVVSIVVSIGSILSFSVVVLLLQLQHSCFSFLLSSCGWLLNQILRRQPSLLFVDLKHNYIVDCWLSIDN